MRQSLFFNKVEKETLAEVFSCEICEIFKNIFFTEHICWLFLTKINEQLVSKGYILLELVLTVSAHKLPYSCASVIRLTMRRKAFLSKFPLFYCKYQLKPEYGSFRVFSYFHFHETKFRSISQISGLFLKFEFNLLLK